MDWGTYTYEIFDRSGMPGAFGIPLPIIAGRQYGGPFEQATSMLGPTANKVTDMFKYGPFDDRFTHELVPFYSTLDW
jgi:hypothetical protein